MRRSKRVLNPPAQASYVETDVRLDYVGSLQNTAIVVSRLHRGEQRLVFCDSRARVEELGNELRRLGGAHVSLAQLAKCGGTANRGGGIRPGIGLRDRGDQHTGTRD